MATTRAVWGIDVGQCALKALRIRPVGDKVEVLAHEHIEHAKILSQPDADRTALVAKALETLLSKHDIRQDLIVVGVPGQHTLSRFTKLPPVDKKKIPDIVRFEANQQIPFDMDEVIWDYQTFGGDDAAEVEVGIFAMRRELVGEHLKAFTAANIEPIVVQSAPLALYNALLYDGQFADGATLLLDIGAQNTDLIVADAKGLWTRNIPIGGSNFTESLLKTFKISFAKAESLKRTAASSKYARQIFQAMRPVFADLVAEIQRSLGFYSSTHRGVRVVRVIGMGNAFKLPGLQKFLQSNLGIEVVRPSTFNKLSVASVENAPRLIEHLLSFGVAYGLALQGLDRTKITSSLLPPEIAKTVVWRRKTPWFWGAAACLALAAAVVWGRFIWDTGALSNAQGAASGLGSSLSVEECLALLKQPPSPDTMAPAEYAGKIVNLGNSLRQHYDTFNQAGSADEQKIRQIAALQDNKALWPRILQEMQNALPQPQAELATALAEGPEAYAAAAQRVARGERNQVFIDSFSVQFSSSTRQAYGSLHPRGSAAAAVSASPSFGADDMQGDEAPQASADGPGFVIRLTGRTPNSGGPRFLHRSFLSNLANVKVEQPASSAFRFEVDQAGPLRSLVQCVQAKTLRKQFGGGVPTGPSPAPAVGAGATSGAQASTARDDEQDPVTGEDTGDDYVFEVLFRVVLDKAGGGSASDGGGDAPQDF
ncbi:MAG: type IV pilus assembly protein PilM [Phycisphaerae bacterium]|nr:type IV pilus assembly protein PilM [Phycisphaerae bacterium]